MGSGASAQSPRGFTFDQFVVLRNAYESAMANTEPLSDAELLALLKNKLHTKKEVEPKVKIVLDMKSPKAKEKRGAGGVFFNAHLEVSVTPT